MNPSSEQDKGSRCKETNSAFPSETLRDDTSWAGFMKHAGVSEYARNWLEEEEINSLDRLAMLDDPALTDLLKQKQVSKPLPFFQTVVVKNIHKAIRADSSDQQEPQDHRAPEPIVQADIIRAAQGIASGPAQGRNINPTMLAGAPHTGPPGIPPQPHQPTSMDDLMFGRIPDNGSHQLDDALRNIIPSHDVNQAQPPHRMGLGYHSSAAGLSIQGKHTKFLDIVDFIPFLPGYVVEKDRVQVAASAGAPLTFETAPRKPDLLDVDPHQWGMANMMLLYRLIELGQITMANLPDYMLYTKSIHHLGTMYEWGSIMMYDREYRRMQAQKKWDWGTESSYLINCHLRKKAPPPPPAAPSNQNNNKRKDSQDKGKRNKVYDKTGKEVCKNFNGGGCTYQGCRHSHVCIVCLGGHPATSHESSKNV